jgi:hypothetical protein
MLFSRTAVSVKVMRELYYLEFSGYLLDTRSNRALQLQ